MPQTQITITATIDHRFIDGSAGGKLANTIRAVFDDPWTVIGAPAKQIAAPAEPAAVVEAPTEPAAAPA